MSRHPDAARPVLQRKPSRAETARANGALSRGPVTAEGKRRSSLNGLVHGMRARGHVAVAALGETPEANAAHVEAVRAELGAVGPVASHLAATVALAILRTARAERLEGELAEGLAADGRSLGKALHDDRDARAALALIQRYGTSADAEVRRSLDALTRLHKARQADLLPGGEEAAAAEGELVAALAEAPEPSEPRIEKIEPLQRFSPTNQAAANDDSSVAAEPKAPHGPTLLWYYRFEQGYGEDRAARYWARLTDEQRAALLAAADDEREGRDPASLHAQAAARLAAAPS